MSSKRSRQMFFVISFGGIFSFTSQFGMHPRHQALLVIGAV